MWNQINVKNVEYRLYAENIKKKVITTYILYIFSKYVSNHCPAMKFLLQWLKETNLWINSICKRLIKNSTREKVNLQCKKGKYYLRKGYKPMYIQKEDFWQGKKKACSHIHGKTLRYVFKRTVLLSTAQSTYELIKRTANIKYFGNFVKLADATLVHPELPVLPLQIRFVSANYILSH